LPEVPPFEGSQVAEQDAEPVFVRVELSGVAEAEDVLSRLDALFDVDFLVVVFAVEFEGRRRRETKDEVGVIDGFPDIFMIRVYIHVDDGDGIVFTEFLFGGHFDFRLPGGSSVDQPEDCIPVLGQTAWDEQHPGSCRVEQAGEFHALAHVSETVTEDIGNQDDVFTRESLDCCAARGREQGVRGADERSSGQPAFLKPSLAAFALHHHQGDDAARRLPEGRLADVAVTEIGGEEMTATAFENLRRALTADCAEH